MPKKKETGLFTFFLVSSVLALAISDHHNKCSNLTSKILKPHSDRLEREMAKCQDLYNNKDIMGGEGCFQGLRQYHIANIEDPAADDILADNYCPSLKESNNEFYLYSTL